MVANEAYFALFSQEADRRVLAGTLRGQGAVADGPRACGAVATHRGAVYAGRQRDTCCARLDSLYMPEHHDRLLVVCHDLTDFKERIELEKDKELVATLQHEEKNAHQAVELDAQRAVDFLGLVRQRMDDQRAVAAKFHSPQLAKLWDDFQAALGTALGDADDAMRSVVERAQRAQQQTHDRIMLRQLVRG